MFQGSLPHKAIKIIGNIVKEWDCERIYIGCSGNFTIERSISELVKCKITSNDVTIYSSTIVNILQVFLLMSCVLKKIMMVIVVFLEIT